MTVELLQRLSTISFVVAAVFFLAAVALFFLLDIPTVIGILSGATARKGVEAIRRQNEEGGDKAHRPSAVNSKRGKITDKITRSGRLVHSAPKMGVAVGTDELADPTEVIPPAAAQETTDLEGYAPLGSVPEETTDLSSFQAQTPTYAPSAPAVEETTDLASFAAQAPAYAPSAPAVEETTDLSAFQAQAPGYAPSAPAMEETTDLSAFQAQAPAYAPSAPAVEETTDLSAYQGYAAAAPSAEQGPFSVDVEINFTDSAEFIE